MPRPKSKLKVPRSVIKSIPIIPDMIMDAYTRKRHEEVGLSPKSESKSPSSSPKPDVALSDADR